MINTLIPKLERGKEPEDKDSPQDGHFWVDEKSQRRADWKRAMNTLKNCSLVWGCSKKRQPVFLGKSGLMHHVMAGLRAHAVYQKNIDWHFISNGQIVIVDEHTGRTYAWAPLERWLAPSGRGQKAYKFS